MPPRCLMECLLPAGTSSQLRGLFGIDSCRVSSVHKSGAFLYSYLTVSPADFCPQIKQGDKFFVCLLTRQCLVTIDAHLFSPHLGLSISYNHTVGSRIMLVWYSSSNAQLVLPLFVMFDKSFALPQKQKRFKCQVLATYNP